MSLTQSHRDIIENEVGIWMDSDRMFTAFEISRAVKAKGVNLRHRDMKEFIHASVHRRRSRTYTRTLLNVGAPQQAWVYHPLTKNPHTFTPLQRNDSSGTSQTSTAAAQTPTGSDSGSTFHSRNLVPLADQSTSDLSGNADGTFGCDNDGNVTIPKGELQKIGISDGSTVHILSDPVNSKLVIGKPGQVDADGADVEATDDEGCLQISHETLEFVDLDWLASYSVAVEGQTLVLSESAG